MNNTINSQIGQSQFRTNAGSLRIFRNFMMCTVLLCATMGMSSCQNNEAPKVKQEQAKSDSLARVNDTLQSQNNAARAQLDQYMTKASQLEEQIKLKDEQIAKLTKEKEALMRKNKQLVAELKGNKKLISSLRDELADTTKSYAAKLDHLENDKKGLMRERDSLVSKYNEVVALGSVLHASNIRLTAIHVKRNEKEKETKRARRADLLRVDFDIDENRIAENGTKKLYLVIKDPSGNLFSSTAVGSGTTTTAKGAPLKYSLLKEIYLKTNEPVKDVSVEWKEERDYQKGIYSIEFYNGGYKIGGGKVELK